MTSVALNDVRHVGAGIDEVLIRAQLETAARTEAAAVRDVLAKARSLGGLDPAEVAILLHSRDRALDEEIFETARQVKLEIYGKRLVLFAPLYVTNSCVNECLYCAFRSSNDALHRRTLNQREIAREVRELLRAGHKRVLLVASEPAGKGWLDYVVRSIGTIYETRLGAAAIRRINVNVAPLSVAGFRELKACGIGTYQLFQETYHRPTYAQQHLGGPKTDFDWHLGAMDRAMAGGIDDVGIGVLFGLYDHRFEVLAMMQHVRHLEREFGVGPHTISVPRIEPAHGSPVASRPPAPVSDEEFKRIVAVIRLAVPYTGIIMSTRETARMRSESFSLGVSQISAGSRTDPGGYSDEADDEAQFSLGDRRSLCQVIRDVVRLGYLPSFCTACYRLGRTGGDFMDLAKPGLIKSYCLPNAILTFEEYLSDHADMATRAEGRLALVRHLNEVETSRRRSQTERRLTRVKAGERDICF